MDKKVEKFKEDYKNIKSRVKVIKKNLRDIRKESHSIAKDACNLWDRGNKTMYKKVEGSDINWKPKFNSLDGMMETLESVMNLEYDIQKLL